jgi:Flp pilus assembly protein TadD
MALTSQKALIYEASTSQKALIYGKVAARTSNFATGIRNVAISDLQRVAEVSPGHW